MGASITSERPVRLFVTDIDGCLSEPYRPFRLDRLAELASVADGMRVDADRPSQPALSICSGRAYPYVEAITQLLRVRAPVVFEAGGGMFDPEKSKWLWNPDFSGGLARQVKDVLEWFRAEIMPGTSLDVDHSKKTQASLAGPKVDEIRHAVPRVEEYVAQSFPDLFVAHTDISIDVVPRVVNKASGMRWLAAATGVPLSEIAFIGDTNGDIPALELVGYAFAPANATQAVKDVAHLVTSGAVIDGVLEAYRWCATRNDLLSTNDE